MTNKAMVSPKLLGLTAAGSNSLTTRFVMMAFLHANPNDESPAPRLRVCTRQRQDLCSQSARRALFHIAAIFLCLPLLFGTFTSGLAPGSGRRLCLQRAWLTIQLLYIPALLWCLQFLGACTRQRPYIVLTELMACSLADAFHWTMFTMNRRRQVQLGGTPGFG